MLRLYQPLHRRYELEDILSHKVGNDALAPNVAGSGAHQIQMPAGVTPHYSKE